MSRPAPGSAQTAATSHRSRLAVTFAVTLAVLVAEIIGAVWTGSLALLVDAAHVLTDSAGLALALVAATLTLRPATPRRTWGYRRAEVLAATGQAAVLLVVGCYALVDGVRRLLAPPEVAGGLLLVFGVIGLAANVAGILILRGQRQANLSLRAAFLEVAADALGSVAVIVGAIVITTTGWTGADAIAGMFIAVLILPRAVRILRETTGILLESTPPGLDLADVRRHILELPHVRDVHDLHASQIATGLPVITAHVVLDDSCFRDGHAAAILDEIQGCVAAHFPVSVEHSTFQLELASHVGHEAITHE